jgi:hypothetical protein
MHLLYRSRGPDRHFHSIANPHQLDGRDQAAPYAMAMTQLLPRDRSWNDDQASVFRLEQ